MAGLEIQVDFAATYEPTPPVRAALEALAQAVLAEESGSDDVEGFTQGLNLGSTHMPIGPGPFVPVAPRADQWRICLGGYRSDDDGNPDGCGFLLQG